MHSTAVTMRTRTRLDRARLRLSVLVVGIFAVLAAIARSAEAAPVETVSNLDASGPGSLAGALGDVDAGGRVEFQPGLAGTIAVANLSVARGVTIAGPGADQLTIDGGGKGRLFYVSTGEPVTIAGLKLTGGRAATANTEGHGGAIAEAGGGHLTLRDLEISGNEVFATHSSAGGGGVSIVDGTALLERVALFDNAAGTDDGQARGGGIEVHSNAGAVTLRNVTVAGNRAESPDAIGGGIVAFNQNVGNRLDLEGVTVTGNEATRFAGGLFASVPTGLAGSVIAGNTAGADADCLTEAGGLLDATAPSLIEDPTGCVVGGPAVPLTGVDPMLGHPGVHAPGATTTLLPLAGSPLIDAIAPAAEGVCAPGATDQRGVPRPQGPACDIGAVEVEQTDGGDSGNGGGSSGNSGGEHPSVPHPGAVPLLLPLPATASTPPPAPRVERLDLRRCIRAERQGRALRVPLRVSLSSPSAVRITVERATGRQAVRRCPAKRAGNPDYSGRFQRVRTVGSPAATPSPAPPTASASTASVHRTITVRARLAPGLYRLSVRAAGAAGSVDPGKYRWLRVLRPAARVRTGQTEP